MERPGSLSTSKMLFFVRVVNCWKLLSIKYCFKELHLSWGRAPEYAFVNQITVARFLLDTRFFVEFYKGMIKCYRFFDLTFELFDAVRILRMRIIKCLFHFSLYTENDIYSHKYILHITLALKILQLWFWLIRNLETF